MEATSCNPSTENSRQSPFRMSSRSKSKIPSSLRSTVASSTIPKTVIQLDVWKGVATLDINDSLIDVTFLEFLVFNMWICDIIFNAKSY